MKKFMLLAGIGLFSLGVVAQVGINTTDPQRTLDVNGKLMVRDLARTSSGIVGIKALFTEADGTVVGASLPGEINITDGGDLEINVNNSGGSTYDFVTIDMVHNNNFDYHNLDLELGSGEANENVTVFKLNNVNSNNYHITGIAGGTDGKRIILYDSSSQTLTIDDDNTGSSAANRILTLGNATLANEGTVELVYDGDANRWVIINLRG